MLFISSVPVLAWFVVAKTYALSSLFLFGAYIAIWRGTRPWQFALGGLFAALAVDARLYLVAVIPVFFGMIWFRRTDLRQSATPFIWFLGGVTLGLLPNLYWIVNDPDTYYFNVLGYHAARSGHGLVNGFHQKARILAAVIGVQLSGQGFGAPFGILLLFNMLFFLLCRKARVWAEVCSAQALGLTIVAVSLLPTPTYIQYFCVAAPFLIAGAIPVVSELRGPAKIAAVSVLFVTVPFALFFGFSGSVMGQALTGGSEPVNYKISSVREVSRVIDQQTSPGDTVLSLWPGYLLESKARCLRGMETHVGLFIAPQLNARELEKYSIRSQAQIEAGLAHHDPCVVVVGIEETMHPYGWQYGTLLAAAGYHTIYQSGHTAVYSCKPSVADRGSGPL